MISIIYVNVEIWRKKWFRKKDEKILCSQVDSYHGPPASQTTALSVGPPHCVINKTKDTLVPRRERTLKYLYFWKPYKWQYLLLLLRSMAITISISISMTTNLILDDFVTFFTSTLSYMGRLLHWNSIFKCKFWSM